jgi:hypothetical protein
MAAGDGSKYLTDGTIEGLTQPSSQRLTNVASLRLSLKDIRQIEPLSFLYKTIRTLFLFSFHHYKPRTIEASSARWATTAVSSL